MRNLPLFFLFIGSFTISLDATIAGETVYMEVLDPLGKLVYAEEGVAQHTKYMKQVTLLNYATGLYYIRVSAGSQNYSDRILIR